MKKGFTLIELLAVIVILAIIALITTPIIIGLIEDARKETFKDSVYGILEAGELKYTEDVLNRTAEEIIFTYTDGVETSNVSGKKLNYQGSKPKNGVVVINNEGKTAVAIYDGKYCAEKNYEENIVSISTKSQEECVLVGTSFVTYYDETKGVNKPQLVAGMTPVKWNGTDWVNTTKDDSEWYNYTITDKKWANAKTADGSMWVWIPRYVYRISNGWHSSTAGTIDIQFSINTDDTRNGTITLDTGTTANASNNKWTNHPAFTFGTTELAGIWVAKFEATAAEGVANGYTADSLCPTSGDNVTTKTVKIIPNIQSWRCITPGNAFTVSRNMETTSVYGWGTSGASIDTHLMKNTEWGAAAYLSRSTYGKQTEIWINPSSDYITGCSGTSVSVGSSSGCLYQYNTANGLQASTTGNIYGIYDMSGGSWEYTAAYVNNGNANLSNGAALLSANLKYKDVYVVTSDSDLNNYNNAINKKGDTIYETSGSYTDANAWNSDYAYMPRLDDMWFARGGGPINAANAGAFYFSRSYGGTYSILSFRIVLAVGIGL